MSISLENEPNVWKKNFFDTNSCKKIMPNGLNHEKPGQIMLHTIKSWKILKSRWVGPMPHGGHMIKGSCNFVFESPSWWVITFGGHWFSFIWAYLWLWCSRDILLICCVLSCEHMFKRFCDFMGGCPSQ